MSTAKTASTIIWAERNTASARSRRKLYTDHEIDRSFHEMAAETILAAGDLEYVESLKLSMADDSLLREEVSECMPAFGEVIRELLARGMSKAAIFTAMHNELSYVAEEILGEDIFEIKRPLFTAAANTRANAATK